MCVGDVTNFLDHPGGWIDGHTDDVVDALTLGVGGAATKAAAQLLVRATKPKGANNPQAAFAAELARQASQAPDLQAYRRTRRDAAAGLLTGPSGIDISAMNLGRTSLLGG